MFCLSGLCPFIHGSLKRHQKNQAIRSSVLSPIPLAGRKTRRHRYTHLHVAFEFIMSHLLIPSLTFPLHEAIHSISRRIPSVSHTHTPGSVHLCMQIIPPWAKMTSDILKNPNKVPACSDCALPPCRPPACHLLFMSSLFPSTV